MATSSSSSAAASPAHTGSAPVRTDWNPTHVDLINYKAPFEESVDKAVQRCVQQVFRLNETGQTYFARLDFSEPWQALVHAQFLEGPIVGRQPFYGETQSSVRLYQVEVDGFNASSETGAPMLGVIARKMFKAFVEELTRPGWFKSMINALLKIPENRIVDLSAGEMGGAISHQGGSYCTSMSVFPYSGPSLAGYPPHRAASALENSGLVSKEEGRERRRQAFREGIVKWGSPELCKRYEKEEITWAKFEEAWNSERAEIGNRVEDLAEDSDLRRRLLLMQERAFERFRTKEISADRFRMVWQELEGYARDQFRGPPWSCVEDSWLES